MFGTPQYRLQQAWNGRGGNKQVAVFAGDVCDVSDEFPKLKQQAPGDTVMLPVADLQKLLPAQAESAPAQATSKPNTPKSKPAKAK
ncbi:MAG: hypothetical protein ABGZ35_14260 [Planctomycetaceae bacterium]